MTQGSTRRFRRKIKRMPGLPDRVPPAPTVTGGGTLGIKPDLVGRPVTSAANFLSPDYKGEAAPQEQPTIGVMDIALALPFAPAPFHALSSRSRKVIAAGASHPV